MVVGGIVFRVVTPNYPGDPELDALGAPAIRTEYLATEDEPWKWALTKTGAFVFERHLDAETVAKKISPRCHAAVHNPPNEQLPERLQPRPEPIATPPSLPPVRRAVRPKKAPAKAKTKATLWYQEGSYA